MYQRIFRVISILLIFITHSSFDKKQHTDAFQELIHNAKDSVVKKQLKKFELGGIERSVDTEDYDVEKVIAYAKTFIGTPHIMSGTSKKGMDCSGLIMIVHKEYGLILPHSSHEQGRYGAIIASVDSLERGDLLFYYSSYKSTNFITHVGIYLGDGTFIHASHSGGVIITKFSDNYWRTKYLFATRFKS
jgi:lipoprotein Spr